jgi:hypothetical protein
LLADKKKGIRKIANPHIKNFFRYKFSKMQPLKFYFLKQNPAPSLKAESQKTVLLLHLPGRQTPEDEKART